MNNLTTVYVVRHAHSERKIENGVSLNAGLTDLGRKQSKKLNNRLKNVKFEAIFSSDLARTKETAEIVALEKKLAVETTDAIRERDYFDYLIEFGGDTNKFTETMRNNLKKLDELGKMQFKLTKNMESAEEAAIRLLTFIREAAIAYVGKTVLILSHGNLMRSLLTHLGYAKFNELPVGSVENTGYFILESDGIEFFVKDINGINIQQNTIRNF